MLERGFVKIDRQITGWRWYRDANTFRVFFHLLLTANYEDHDFENITVQRGQRVASRALLAKELGISEQSVRTALRHLESTGEITSSGASKFTVFSINHYDKYQSVTSTLTNDQPAANQQLTSDQPQCKKDKKDKKEKEDGRSHKHRYGAFRHVLLTEQDYTTLLTEFGEALTAEYIRRLDEYLEQTGKIYRNHNLTIRRWMDKDGRHTLEDGNEKYAGTAVGKGFI